MVGIAVLIAIGVSLLVVVGGERETPEKKSSAELTELSESTAPWTPEQSKLGERIKALGLPAPGTEKYHVHAQLAVYVDGQNLPVPKNIGLASGAISALHTHETDGVIHLEADAPFQASLSDFFGIWGVKFSDSQLGGYKNDGSKSVQVFVNGQPVSDPANYVIKSKDKIVVGYGAPDSFPKTISQPLPEEL